MSFLQKKFTMSEMKYFYLVIIIHMIWLIYLLMYDFFKQKIIEGNKKIDSAQAKSLKGGNRSLGKGRKVEFDLQ